MTFDCILVRMTINRRDGEERGNQQVLNNVPGGIDKKNRKNRRQCPDSRGRADVTRVWRRGKD